MRCGGFCRGVTGLAFGIVIGLVVVELLVRIVTGEATDAAVVGGEALAVLKTVGLEADIDFSLPVIAHYRIPGAMALTAEVGGLDGVHGLEFGGDGGEVVLGGVGHVLKRAEMTARAVDAGTQRIEGEFGPVSGVGGVAVEALVGFPGRDHAAHGLIDVVRNDALVAGGGGESIFTGEIADHALEVMAVFLEDPGLGVLAEHPANGESERVFAVRDGVSAVAIFGLDGVGVAVFEDGQDGVGVEDRIGAGILKRVVHGGVDIGRGHADVAGGAGGRRGGLLGLGF